MTLNTLRYYRIISIFNDYNNSNEKGHLRIVNKSVFNLTRKENVFYNIFKKGKLLGKLLGKFLGKLLGNFLGKLLGKCLGKLCNKLLIYFCGKDLCMYVFGEFLDTITLNEEFFLHEACTSHVSKRFLWDRRRAIVKARRVCEINVNKMTTTEPKHQGEEYPLSEKFRL